MKMKPAQRAGEVTTTPAQTNREEISDRSSETTRDVFDPGAQSDAPGKPRPTANLILQLQRTVGNRAVGRMLEGRSPADGILQRTAIDPNAYFGAARPDASVNAGINGNELKGFGVQVNGRLWHTQLTFDAPATPGAQNGQQMNAEGSGVHGVIGPEHPYGSQPSSADAAQNNQTAGAIRGVNPHGHVAAHIVNDQLGGPGISQNLFAFPGAANTLMESQVERYMKAAVEGGHFIYYEASVQHPANGPADSITMSWNKLDDTGADIGGGQTNEVVRANLTAANVAATPLAAGTAATKMSLRHPTNESAIRIAPWGPFQMPDPKRHIQLLPYLDISSFPAVGTKRAFEEFLRNFNNSQNQMLLFFSFLGSDLTTFTSNLSRWISSKNSGIQVKTRRGITKDIVNDLSLGTTAKKEAAFLAAIQSGDGNLVISHSAGELATLARSNARSRV